MYPELSDALIRRILKSRNQYEGFSQFADLLKTRDITRSAICRSLVRIFLGQKTKAPGHIPYARVLGFQKNSAPLLSQIKKSSSIPLITKPPMHLRSSMKLRFDFLMKPVRLPIFTKCFSATKQVSLSSTR